jgi:hypothetical protein
VQDGITEFIGSRRIVVIGWQMMKTEYKPAYLTRLQLAHATVAMQEYIKILQREAAENPQGGELEDILIVESVLAELSRAKAAPGVAVIPVGQ